MHARGDHHLPGCVEALRAVHESDVVATGPHQDPDGYLLRCVQVAEEPTSSP